MQQVFGYIAFAAIWLAASIGVAATPLSVYTAISPAEMSRISKIFSTVRPDIELRWVRNSTGRILARLRYEISQPKADIVWGVAASALAELVPAEYFEPYTPKGFERLDPKFSDTGDQPLWVGLRVWASALCVNTTTLKANNLEPPNRWGDLLAPAYRGKVLALDPNGSRTGKMALSGWFALWGDAGAWRYMEGLHRNVVAYLQPGGTPCNLVAQGLYPIGISFAYRAVKLKGKALPIIPVIPGDGVGWDIEAMAIVRGTPYPEAAHAFADWSLSGQAMGILSRGFGMTTLAGPAGLRKIFPAEIRKRLAPIDFTAGGPIDNKVLSEWRLRFGAKAIQGKKE
ncbi:MAG: Iron deficiency-induced protein A [Alphaproteobacteria bacterium MarineAlpha4_Bin2]|nr:MAG: Iron deficiency-induced protein A [Alphaproteobacteria bacterium MarineAlpha4_Bin2]